MKDKNYSSIDDLVRTVKAGGVYERMALAYAPHLYWLLPYVEKLGKAKMVECGVAKGGVIACCSKVNPELEVIGLDSWEPMPDFTEKDNAEVCEPWKNMSWGTPQDVYNTYKTLQAPTDKLTLIKGWFEDTIPPNIDKFNDLDILRIDSDYYDSIKYCLDTLYDKVKPGGVIIFDDWTWNLKGVSAALNDFLDDRGIERVKINTHGNDGPGWFSKPSKDVN